MTLRDRVAVGAFRAGWRFARAVPEDLAVAASRRAADVVARRGGARVEQLRRNLAHVRPDAGPAELDALVRDGLRSYARYWLDAFRLPAWSRERTVGAARFEHGEALSEALADGRGAVGFLGHLGNWDHAAAWSATELAPVVTVAERLRPEQVYAEFLAFRRSLGVEVLPLGDPASFGTLLRRLRAGAFVPLLADRDLTGAGVEVDFLAGRVRMAQGPAVLALATGSPLFPVGLFHEVHEGRRVLVLDVADQVPVPARRAGEEPREHRRRAVAEMTQACADALAAVVVAHPDDWHVLQPVFQPVPPASPGR